MRFYKGLSKNEFSSLILPQLFGDILQGKGEITSHIGNRLKEIRSLKGLTQTQVSENITSASHYSNIEAGRFEPSQTVLKLLAERLSVPTIFLVNRHIQDDDMKNLLKRFESLLNQELLDEAKSFRTHHKIDFAYIPSLVQEFQFRLLRCSELFKTRKFEAFKKVYAEKVFPFVNEYFLDSLLPALQEKWHYISGLYHYLNNDYRKSITFFDNVLESSENKALQARVSFNIALANFYLLQYKDALHYVKKSKILHLNAHNWPKSAECYNLLSILYRLTGDLTNSETSIYKGLQMANDESEEIYLRLLHTHALLYEVQGKKSESLESLNKCISLKVKYNSYDLFISYQKKLNILLTMQNESSLKKNIALAKPSCKSKSQEIELQFIEGKLYHLQNRFADYEKSLQNCIDYYLKNRNWTNLKKAANHFSHYYAKKKRYKKAYELSQLCLLANANIYKEESFK